MSSDEQALEVGRLPIGAKPRLVVHDGQYPNREYPIREGVNWIGRPDRRAVEIDLEDQEFPDDLRVSREHARITLECDRLFIEDAGSADDATGGVG